MMVLIIMNSTVIKLEYMDLNLENFKSILYKLSKNRPIFHSEADFQHELAFIMHKHGFTPRLEIPYSNLPLDKNNSIKIELDILLNKKIGVELKYKTQIFKCNFGEELFKLKNHGARNLGQFDFLDDIRRLEILKKNGIIEIGFAVLLTNDNLYWESTKRKNFSKDFSIEDGKKFIQNQNYNWIDNPKVSSFGKKRTSPFVPITFNRNFNITWYNYSVFSSKYGLFKFTMVEI